MSCIGVNHGLELRSLRGALFEAVQSVFIAKVGFKSRKTLRDSQNTRKSESSLSSSSDDGSLEASSFNAGVPVIAFRLKSLLPMQLQVNGSPDRENFFSWVTHLEESKGLWMVEKGSLLPESPRDARERVISNTFHVTGGFLADFSQDTFEFT